MIPTVPAPENSILIRSLWQVLVYVLGAMLVGSWLWVWNTTSTLHELQTALARMPEVVLRAEANRSVIDAYSVRLARLEEASQLSRDDRATLHRENAELRQAVAALGAAVNTLRIEHGQILTILQHAGIRSARPGPGDGDRHDP